MKPEYKLTKKQTDYLGALLWLTDPIAYRREGRSYLLAMAYIANAIHYPNVRVRPRDHNPDHHSDVRLMDEIKQQVSQMPKKTKEAFKIGMDFICYEPDYK